MTEEEILKHIDGRMDEVAIRVAKEAIDGAAEVWDRLWAKKMDEVTRHDGAFLEHIESKIDLVSEQYKDLKTDIQKLGKRVSRLEDGQKRIETKLYHVVAQNHETRISGLETRAQ